MKLKYFKKVNSDFRVSNIMQFDTFQHSTITYIVFEIIGCYSIKKTKIETKKEKRKDNKRKGKILTLRCFFCAKN